MYTHERVDACAPKPVVVLSADGTMSGRLAAGERHDYRVSFGAWSRDPEDFRQLAEELPAQATVVLDSDQESRRALMLARIIRTARPEIPVVLYTSRVGQHPFPVLKTCGISGVLDKAKPLSEFFAGIHAARSGLFVSSELAPRVMNSEIVLPDTEASRKDVNMLTEREKEVLNLMAEGLANREIATKLFISENTVKNHVRRVLEKLDAPSRMAAVVYAVRRRIVDIK